MPSDQLEPTKGDVRDWKETNPKCKFRDCGGTPTVYAWGSGWNKGEGLDGYCSEHEGWAEHYSGHEPIKSS